MMFSRRHIAWLWLVATMLAGCKSPSEPPAVSISSITPADAEEGTSVSVQIAGDGFHVRLATNVDNGEVTAGEIEVTLGAVALTDVVLQSEDRIDARVPDSLNIGTHSLTVRFADGREATLADAFLVWRACQDVGDCDDGDPCTTSQECVQNRCVVGPPDKDEDGDGAIDQACGGTDCADTAGSDPACNNLDGANCHPGLAGSDGCDGADNDCDGNADEDPDVEWWPDNDMDGFGDMLATGEVTCSGPAGSVDNNRDCADVPGSDPNCGNTDGSNCSPEVFEGPVGDATCDDGIDNDCDGDTDMADSTCGCVDQCDATCGGSDCCTTPCPGGDCTPVCDVAGCSCNIACANATSCNANCTEGATCVLSCQDAAECAITCTNNSTCYIDCLNADRCDVVHCVNGAQCVLDCSGATSCEFNSCAGGEQSCPGNITVCNRDCP